MKLILSLTAVITLPFTSFAQDHPDPLCDDFDSPNADLSSWSTHTLSGSATYGVTDGTLEILAPAGSNAPALAVMREAPVLDDFVVEADIHPDPVTGKVPIMTALFARATDDPGIGTSYGVSIGHGGSTLEIWDLFGSRGSQLSQKSLSIPWEKTLHLVFRGVGSELTAQLFDGEILVGETSTSNSKYKSGKTGVVQFHLHRHSGAVITRFDNFKAYHPENPPKELPEPVTDSFDDAKDDVSAWNFVGGGATATLTTPDNLLQIFAPSSSNAPGIAAFLKDRRFDDVVIEADVLPDPATGKIPEMVGLIVRNNGGKFYAMSIGHTGSSLEIWDIAGSRGNKLSSKSSLTIPWEKPLRFVFKAIANQLTAQLFDGETLVGETSVTNNRYQVGTTGLIQFHLFKFGEVQTRFDNFKVYHPDNAPKVTHKVTIQDVDPTQGAVTLSTTGPVEEGTTITATATPAEGYHFVRWEGDGIADPTASETEVTVASALSIHAIFARDIAEGTTITVNPIIDGFTFQLDRHPTGNMLVSWTGGGHLQRLNEETETMETVAKASPFLADTPKGIFRILDPWNSSRETEIYVPSSYMEEKAIPLVIALHARHPSPSYLKSYLQLQALADSRGFLLAHPLGVRKDSANYVGWENDEELDDSGFLIGLIEAAKAQLNVDANRIYLYGHSAGGRMAYETVEGYSDHIAGIASLEGLPRVPYDPATAGAEPVHILHLHGTSTGEQVDVPINGGSVTVPSGDIVTVASVNHMITSWGAVAGHDATQRDPEPTLDLQNSLPGMETTVSRLTGGTTSVSVEYWEIENAIHHSPGNHDDFSDEVIDWLLAHPKPEKRPFTASGLLIPCEEDGCEEIRALVEGTPLAEGATQRRFFKEDKGTTNAFGAIASQYVLDETMAEIPGFDQPVPVRSVGRMLITTEADDETYWEMEANLLPTGYYTYTATMLRAKGALEGAYVNLTGKAFPDSEGFSYQSIGWWHEPK